MIEVNAIRFTADYSWREKGNAPSIGMCGQDHVNSAGNGVGEVVVASGRVVDRILTGPRRSTFEADKLRDEAVVIEQVNKPGIDGRQ